MGLALPILGVLMISDLEGDEKATSDMLPLRFCLLGVLVRSGAFAGVLRPAVALFSLVEMAKGSGLES